MNTDWITYSKPAVGLLSSIFDGDFAAMGSIMVMQAEVDIDGLCKALELVSEFCQKQISELQKYKERKK